MNIIERIWRRVKRRRLVYTALPQGKVSHAVKPLAEYKYRPQKKEAHH